MMLHLEYMQQTDKAFVMRLDTHVTEEAYRLRVLTKKGYVLWNGSIPIGLMHYSVLWDNLPFLNLLIIQKEYQNCGFGCEAMRQWEADMKSQGYRMVLVSTQVDETAQFFYRKIGYVDCGGLLFENTPHAQPMELFMKKVL